MLFVAEDRCPKTVAEWNHLRYKEGMRSEYGEASLEGEDHAFDAARYFVMTRPTPERERNRPDWLQAVQRKNREESRVGSSFLATRGLSRWGRTGVSPYNRSVG
jgi:hypothetical protein